MNVIPRLIMDDAIRHRGENLVDVLGRTGRRGEVGGLLQRTLDPAFHCAPDPLPINRRALAGLRSPLRMAPDYLEPSRPCWLVRRYRVLHRLLQLLRPQRHLARLRHCAEYH